MNVDIEAAIAALKRPRGRPPKHAAYVQMGSPASNGLKHRPILPRPVDDSWSPSKEERSQIQGAMDILAARNISVVPVMNPMPRDPSPTEPVNCTVSSEKNSPEYDDSDHDPDMDFAPMFCEVIVGQTDVQASSQSRDSPTGLSITPRVVLGSPPRLEKCYRCDLCPRSYSSRAGLWYHKKAHSGDKQYSCFICFKRFSQKSHLEVHMKYHRSKGDGDPCDLSVEGAAVNNSAEAQDDCHGDEQESWTGHGSDEEDVEDGEALRDEPENLRRSESPEKHTNNGHGRDSPRESPRDSPHDNQRSSHRPTTQSQPSDINFAQMFAESMYRNNENNDVAGGAAQQAIRHGSARYNDLIISAIPPAMPPPEPRTLQPAQIQALLAKGPKLDKCYKCELCSNTYSSRAGLWYHRKTHSGNKQHTCRVCSQSFKQKSHLQAHMRTHEPEHPYGCTQCDATFSDPNSLQSHLYSHSSGESPFRCSYCGERFARQLLLIQHERTHAIEKPLKCPHCERSFAHKNNLVNHMRVHRSS